MADVTFPEYAAPWPRVVKDLFALKPDPCAVCRCTETLWRKQT
jgi:hypothetical protein